MSDVLRVRDNLIEIAFDKDATDEDKYAYLAYYSDDEARQLIEQLKEVVDENQT